jgi:AraC family transcriptional regulator, transcriptional activator FtrA
MSSHRVVALVHPPQSLFELSAAVQVFGMCVAGHSRYELCFCTIHPGLVPTDTRIELEVNEGLAALNDADTIVIPGWNACREHHAIAGGEGYGETDPALGDLVPRALVERLHVAHARGARVLAIGTGTFVLAQAGLLRGRRATTNWQWVAELAARYPEIEVDGNVLYVDHGDVATSAGVAAGIDLCLHIVRNDHGAAYAADVSRGMAAPPHRAGDQAQWSRNVPLHANGGALAKVLDWAAGHLGEPLTVKVLAGQARMSARTFVRRFTEEVGETPGQWVLTQRVSAARELLERTDLPVETIAVRVGLSSAVNLRTHFRRFVGTTPAEYRRGFQQRKPAEVRAEALVSG